ncbi:adenylate/guanylate cyclase domain-containing protein [soil metagenome]
MGRDENGTLARLKAHRTERLEPVLASHGGRLVKLTGDGALIEFPSAVDALGAAIAFQQAMADANRDQPEDARIVFRVGLHLGDLIVDSDDLYGDGVNVAARLEAEAPVGGIVISRNVHDAVVGRLKATFDDLGALELKNIERPLQAFRVNWNAADWTVKAASTALPPSDTSAQGVNVPLALPDKSSIAVLPFQNMSGDPEQEYFVDGLVEDIITALSRFKSLFVIARNSSFTYKGKAVDIKQIGRELGVRYVLEGSVRKAGSRVRITGQLIDSETGAHIWAERYDGDSADVFELQDKVTLDVVGAITPRLEQAEIERSSRVPTENLHAYDYYLRGTAKFYKGGREACRESLELFYHAIALDPNFAAAYGMAVRCHAFIKSNTWQVDNAREDAETERLARQAVVLARDDATVLTWAAWGLAMVVRDLESAASLIARALALNPNLAMAWAASAWVNVWLGKAELAIEQFPRAIRLSPLDPNMVMIANGTAHAFYMAGRYEEALAVAAVPQEPPIIPLVRIAAASAALAGHHEDARKFLAQYAKMDPTRHISNLDAVMGPYRRREDLDRYKEGLRLAGLSE